MKCITFANAAYKTDKKYEKGVLTIYTNGCKFITEHTSHTLQWSDLLTVEVSQCQVEIPGFLFIRKKPAIRFRTKEFDQSFIMAPTLAKHIIWEIRKEQDDIRKYQAAQAKAAQETREKLENEAQRLADLHRAEELQRQAEEHKAADRQRKEELQKKEEALKLEKLRREEEIRNKEIALRLEDLRRKESLRKHEATHKSTELRKSQESHRLSDIQRKETHKYENAHKNVQPSLSSRHKEVAVPETQPSRNFTDNTLYVYKGQIVCLRRQHTIEQATAVLQNVHGREIRLNVSHCCLCNKFFIHSSIYKNYRDRYGTILGDIKMLKGEHFDSLSSELATESTLHLCGYTVRQNAGFSASERQAIIVAVIENGAMSKGDIINLLRYLIDLNRSKESMHLAVAKWEEDLDFTLYYNIYNQSHYRIHEITSYNKNRYIIVGQAPTVVSHQHNNMYVGKRVVHNDPKYGRGTITGATKDTVSILFDNGKATDFTKKIFAEGKAQIIS